MSTFDQLAREAAEFAPPLAESRILVVDDEDAVREVLRSLLEMTGFTVSAASSAEEGLELLEAERPRVVITDKNLPGINGIELITKGKALLPDVEFLLITGFASLDSAMAAIDAGAFSYIKKPFGDIQEIVRRVEAAMEKNRASRQNELLLTSLGQAMATLEASRAKTEEAHALLHQRTTELTRSMGQVLAELREPLLAVERRADGLLEHLRSGSAGSPGESAEAELRELLREVGEVRDKVALISTHLSSLASRQATRGPAAE